MINCVDSGAIWLRFSDGWPQSSKATRMTKAAKAAKRAAPFLLQLQLQSKEPTGRMNNKTLQHDSGGVLRGGPFYFFFFVFSSGMDWYAFVWLGMVNDQCGNFVCGWQTGRVLLLTPNREWCATNYQPPPTDPHPPITKGGVAVGRFQVRDQVIRTLGQYKHVLPHTNKRITSRGIAGRGTNKLQMKILGGKYSKQQAAIPCSNII